MFMSKFNFIATEIPGVIIIEPTVFGDSRGYFMETYQAEEFAAAGIPGPFVQDNQSKSTRGVLRGLHFGKWVGVTLSAENKKQFYIPQGFAHGFLVLSEEAEFTYKCTDYYDPAAEGGVKWDDPDVGIVWPAVDGEIRLSAKDGEHRGFKEQTYEFFERW